MKIEVKEAPDHILINQTFWCGVCDYNSVRKNDSDSGKFFYQFGHIHKPTAIGDHVKIVWAICSECLKKME